MVSTKHSAPTCRITCSTPKTFSEYRLLTMRPMSVPVMIFSIERTTGRQSSTSMAASTASAIRAPRQAVSSGGTGDPPDASSPRPRRLLLPLALPDPRMNRRRRGPTHSCSQRRSASCRKRDHFFTPASVPSSYQCGGQYYTAGQYPSRRPCRDARGRLRLPTGGQAHPAQAQGVAHHQQATHRHAQGRQLRRDAAGHGEG